MDAISGIDYQSIGGIELSFDTRQSNSKDQGKRSAFSVAAANPEKNTDATGLKLDPEKQKVIQEMKARDTEVRSHEQAHIAASGGNAKGGASFTMQRGPDGVMYATGGEVSIDTSSVPDDPDATIEKARQIQAAANAPANPSSQDRAVAASAAQMEAQAQQEKTQKTQEENDGENGTASKTGNTGKNAKNANASESTQTGQAFAAASTQQALFSEGNASGLVPGQYYQSLGFSVNASGNSAQNTQPYLIFNAQAQNQAQRLNTAQGTQDQNAMSSPYRLASNAYARQMGTSALAPMGTGISRTA